MEELFARRLKSVRSNRSSRRLIISHPTFPPLLLDTQRHRSIISPSLAMSLTEVAVTKSLIMTEDTMAKLEGETEGRLSEKFSFSLQSKDEEESRS